MDLDCQNCLVLECFFEAEANTHIMDSEIGRVFYLNFCQRSWMHSDLHTSARTSCRGPVEDIIHACYINSLSNY